MRDGAPWAPWHWRPTLPEGPHASCNCVDKTMCVPGACAPSALGHAHSSVMPPFNSWLTQDVPEWQKKRKLWGPEFLGPKTRLNQRPTNGGRWLIDNIWLATTSGWPFTDTGWPVTASRWPLTDSPGRLSS